MSEILKTLGSDSWSVAAYLAGIYIIATAAGMVTGVKFANISLPSPKSTRVKFLLCSVGLVLIIFGVFRALRFPEYKPAVFEKLAYTGTDAYQIAADGKDIYLLKDNGNIHKISEKGAPQVDPGTGTKQIAAVGGVLYILKNNGNIWIYQTIIEKPSFEIKDSGQGTSQIETVGETLYVLKENGNIWRSNIHPAEADVNAKSDDFIQIDGGTGTSQLTSSGSILYILKKNGNIWMYAPALGQSFQEIYKDGDVEWIKADGGELYFIKRDGTPCRLHHGVSVIEDAVAAKPKNPSVVSAVGKCFAIDKEKRAKKLDALGGTVYILTNQGKIIRYSAETENVRELIEAGADNKAIAAYYQDLFAIKTDGTVKRYNEGRLKR